MEGSGWNPAQGDSVIASNDWRSELSAESRQRIVNKIMDTLKKYLPIPGNQGVAELNKIAVRFEEKIYTAATSQRDYLRKISLQMLTMESKSTNTNSLLSNCAGGSQNPPDEDMEGSGWNPAQGDSVIASNDWRSELSAESRQRIVNKIMDTLKKYLPIPGNQGVAELNKIAVRFEEKIYTAATSQRDYLRKISLQMLTMESKSTNTNSLLSNSAGGSQNPPDEDVPEVSCITDCDSE